MVVIVMVIVIDHYCCVGVWWLVVGACESGKWKMVKSGKVEKWKMKNGFNDATDDVDGGNCISYIYVALKRTHDL